MHSGPSDACDTGPSLIQLSSHSLTFEGQLTLFFFFGNVASLGHSIEGYFGEGGWGWKLSICE